MDLDRAASAREVRIAIFWDLQILGFSRNFENDLWFQEGSATDRLASAPTQVDSAIRQAEIPVDSARIRPALIPSQLDSAIKKAAANVSLEEYCSAHPENSIQASEDYHLSMFS